MPIQVITMIITISSTTAPTPAPTPPPIIALAFSPEKLPKNFNKSGHHILTGGKINI